MDNLNKIGKEIFIKTLFINNENTFRTWFSIYSANYHILLHNCIFKQF